ncbi:MAG: flagellar filament capping protein FliD [Brevinemataceae bacterium]
MKRILFIMLLMPYMIHSQRVQLSSLPGDDKGMDINDMLNQIMAPHYQEVTNLQNKRRDKELEIQLWQELRSNINNFEQINRYIFGYESAFRTLTNDNSDPSSLQISTERSAKHGSHIVNIKQLAQADSFSSEAYPISEEIKQGVFSVTMDQQTSTINFTGGTIQTLSDMMRKELSNIADISLINTSSENKTLIIKGKKEGKASSLKFSGDLSPLFQINMLTTNSSVPPVKLSWNTQTNSISISNSSIELTTNIMIKPDTSLSFVAKIQKISNNVQEEKIQETALTELNIGELGQISNNQIQLPGTSPIFHDINTQPVQSEPKEPEQTIKFLFDDGSIKQFPLQQKNYYESLKDMEGKSIKQIQVTAEQAVADISDITLTSASPNGTAKPSQFISQAQNALFLLNGVHVERPENSFSDLLDGVTMTLLRNSEKNIHITIKPDKDLVKDTIIQWVLAYNNVMTELYTLGTAPIEKIGRLKPLHQREKDGSDLKEAAFLGNPMLSSFRDRMRRLTGSQHNSTPNQLGVLDQIGIFVKRRQSAAMDPEVLKKGTLTLETSELDKQLESNFDQVYRLFVSESGSDTTAVRGAAVCSIEILKTMTGGSGYLPRIEKESGNEIKNITGKISKKEDEITRIESNERKSLLQMNQAIAAGKAQNESMRQRFGN